MFVGLCLFNSFSVFLVGFQERHVVSLQCLVNEVLTAQLPNCRNVIAADNSLSSILTVCTLVQTLPIHDLDSY